MEHYDIIGTANLLFKTYLSDRKQYVYFNGISMNVQMLVLLKAQFLFFLLFWIYINHLCKLTTLEWWLSCLRRETKLFRASSTMK